VENDNGEEKNHAENAGIAEYSMLYLCFYISPEFSHNEGKLHPKKKHGFL
jgi:hypothetical protein